MSENQAAAQPPMLDFDVQLRRQSFELHVALSLSLSGIIALYGQNGSGKSTLLRILAGLEPHARGRISFAGETWQNDDDRIMRPTHQRGVGVIFQDPRLFPHLNVAGNLSYAETRAARSETSQEPDARGASMTRDAVIQSLDLEPLLSRQTPELSGGERQRVALARALLARPRILLLDEPLSAVDNRRRHEILDYIARITALFELPMIYVTHSLDEVVRLADQMMLLSKGRLIASGQTEAMLERLDLAPATGRFEASVALRATVQEHDTVYQLTKLIHEGMQALWVPLIDAPAGTEVRLRIRARDVAIATVEPTNVSTRNIMAGTLVEVLSEPDTAYAETLIDIGGAKLRARITRKSVDELGLTIGMPVVALIKSVSLDRIITSG